jgi:hypothetical protein
MARPNPAVAAAPRRGAHRPLVTDPEIAAHDVAEDRDLRIAAPHGALRIILERLRPVAEVRLQPRIVLLLLQQELQECLRCVRELAVPEHHRVEREPRHRRLCQPALRQQAVLGILSDRCQLLVALQGEVHRDAVRGQPDFVGRIGAIVADVTPGDRARHEGLVELLQVLQRLDRLLAVDGDGVVLVDKEAAVRPDDPVGECVAVAHRVAQGEARRLAGAVQLAAQVEELVEIIGRRVITDGINR